MWEVGVLLIGIGILILCIFAATTIRDVGSAVKNAERLMIDKKNELESLIDSTSFIMKDVEALTNRVNRLTNITGIATTVSHIMGKDEIDKRIEKKIDEKMEEQAEQAEEQQDI